MRLDCIIIMIQSWGGSWVLTISLSKLENLRPMQSLCYYLRIYSWKPFSFKINHLIVVIIFEVLTNFFLILQWWHEENTFRIIDLNIHRFVLSFSAKIQPRINRTLCVCFWNQWLNIIELIWRTIISRTKFNLSFWIKIINTSFKIRFH